MAEPLLVANQPRLLYPPNAVPWVNQAHPASQGLAFSAISVPGALLGIDRARAFAVTGGFNGGIDGRIGPYATPAAQGDYATLSAGRSGPAVTLAAICFGSAVSANSFVVGGDGSGGDTAIGTLTVGGSYVFRTNLSNIASGFSLASGTPYFIAASALSAVKVNFLVLNLRTGAIQSSTVATAQALSNDSSYAIGTVFSNTTGRSWQQPIGAVVASSAFLSISQMLEWAADPWGFWYDQRLARFISLSLRGPPPTVALAAVALGNAMSRGAPAGNTNLGAHGQGTTGAQPTARGGTSLSALGQGGTAVRPILRGLIPLVAHAVGGTLSRVGTAATVSLAARGQGGERVIAAPRGVAFLSARGLAGGLSRANVGLGAIRRRMAVFLRGRRGN